MSEAPRNLKRFVLLWLIGLSLRVTLLAVPPLLLEIRSALGLSSAGVAALTTAPLLLFAVAAPLGSAVVSTVGARRTLIAGLFITACASALRVVASDAAVLFAFTCLMGLGIAAVQPAVPTLVQSWAPDAIGRATATYVNGILVAEAVAASFTLPVLLPLLGAWEPSLAVWAAPVALTAALVAIMSGEAERSTERARRLPSWTEARTWLLGAIQAGGSVAYFASNALLPVFLDAHGRADLVGWSLAALNTSQLLASVVVGSLPLRTSAGRASLVVNGALIVASASAAAVAPDLAVLWSALIGFSSAVVFTVSLALPAVSARGPDVARLAAGMMTIGYGCAFLVPLAGGWLFDLAGEPWTLLVPVVIAGTVAIAAGGIAAHERILGANAGTFDPAID